MKAVRVRHGKVVYGKHRNDYPNGRDKGSMHGGNVRYDRKNPTRGMVQEKGYKKSEPSLAELAMAA